MGLISSLFSQPSEITYGTSQNEKEPMAHNVCVDEG